MPSIDALLARFSSSRSSSSNTSTSRSSSSGLVGGDAGLRTGASRSSSRTSTSRSSSRTSSSRSSSGLVGGDAGLRTGASRTSPSRSSSSRSSGSSGSSSGRSSRSTSGSRSRSGSSGGRSSRRSSSSSSGSSRRTSSSSSSRSSSGLVGGDAGLRTGASQTSPSRSTQTTPRQPNSSPPDGLIGGDAGLRTGASRSTSSRSSSSGSTSSDGLVGGDAGLRTGASRTTPSKSTRRSDSGLIGGDAGLRTGASRTSPSKTSSSGSGSTASDAPFRSVSVTQIKKQEERVKQRKTAFEKAVQRALAEGKATKTKKGIQFTDFETYKKVNRLYKSYIGAYAGLEQLYRRYNYEWLMKTEEQLKRAKIPKKKREKIMREIKSGKTANITTPTSIFIEPIYWRKVPGAGYEFDATLRRAAKKSEPTYFEKLYLQLYKKEAGLRAAEVDVSFNKNPLYRFGKGLELSARGLGLGILYSGVAIPIAAERIIKNPIKGTKEVAIGTGKWFAGLPQRGLKALSGSPVEGGLMAGEILGGFMLGEGIGRGLAASTRGLSGYRLQSVVDFKPPIELYSVADFAQSKIKTKPAILGRTFETPRRNIAFIEKADVFQTKISPFKYTFVYKSPLRGKKIISIVGEEGGRVTLTTRRIPKIGKPKTQKTTWDYVGEFAPSKPRSFTVQQFPLSRGRMKPFEIMRETTKRGEQFKATEVRGKGSKQVLLTKTAEKPKIQLPQGFETFIRTSTRGDIHIPLVFPPGMGIKREERIHVRRGVKSPNMFTVRFRGGEFLGSIGKGRLLNFTGAKGKFDLFFGEKTRFKSLTKEESKITYKQKQDTLTRTTQRNRVSTIFGTFNLNIKPPAMPRPRIIINKRKKGDDFDLFFEEKRRRKKTTRKGKNVKEGIAFMPTLIEIETFEAKTGREAGALISPKAAPYWVQFKEKLFLTEIPVAQEILRTNKKKRKTNKGKKNKRKKSRGVKR